MNSPVIINLWPEGSAQSTLVTEQWLPRIEEAAQLTREYWARPESNSPDEWENNEEIKLSSLEVEQHLFRWDRFRRSRLECGGVRFLSSQRTFDRCRAHRSMAQPGKGHRRVLDVAFAIETDQRGTRPRAR